MKFFIVLALIGAVCAAPHAPSGPAPAQGGGQTILVRLVEGGSAQPQPRPQPQPQPTPQLFRLEEVPQPAPQPQPAQQSQVITLRRVEQPAPAPAPPPAQAQAQLFRLEPVQGGQGGHGGYEGHGTATASQSQTITLRRVEQSGGAGGW